MHVKERILTIRLLEKIHKDAAYAESIGIVVKQSPTELGEHRKGVC